MAKSDSGPGKSAARKEMKGQGEAAPGHLYVVATPIGNLADITLRALKILASVDVIAAEDTRRTRKLLSHYQIAKPLVSCHTHNYPARGPELIRRLLAGQSVAVVSDAGTPGFSDPGAALVADAWGANVPVQAIPGPAAGLAALSMSGFTGDVTFIGFLPRPEKKRLDFFRQLAREPRIFILYESPRRLARTLQELSQTMPGRQVLVVRELTKLFEESWRGALEEVAGQLAGSDLKGECTLVLSRPLTPDRPVIDLKQFLLAKARETGKTGRALALEVAAALGISRREAYQACLELQAAWPEPEKIS